ncbi:MAG TPA: pyridoxal phosphate-dependent aminotransferase family protein [Planctomycetaceae bacterium]|nr:pyridoxal phosphate-dependent aminotransferase family protein [Planctomycetaceae bacterium]
MPDLLETIADSLERSPLVHFYETGLRAHSGLFLKLLTMEAVGPDRQVKLNGRWVVNFGSDSFLGLDQDPRVQEAVRRGLDRWGTHNGTSRAFSSVAANFEAERKLASWLQAETTLIYPSVTLANHGALPALVTRHDALVVDHDAHHTVHEALDLVRAHGIKTALFAHNDPSDLTRVLNDCQPYRHAIVALDGIDSMTGTVSCLPELRAVAETKAAVLYVDDAHGTGILGDRGRGTVLESLGDYRNTVVVGSLSKAFSCFGAFLACPERLRIPLEVRSGPFIFGGPVPPPYLEAVSTVVDILNSPEYDSLRQKLQSNMDLFLAGVRPLGVKLLGGVGAVVSIVVGEEEATLAAGKELFERGYYVQSVVFPGVPHHSGLLRIQVNANHRPESVAGLVAAICEIHAAGLLPNVASTAPFERASRKAACPAEQGLRDSA